MHGPKKRAGGVAEIEGVRTPSKVAQMVMDLTDHHLLVGQGRAGVRAQHGVQDRGRPEHRELARQVARVEAPDRSAALPVAEGAPDRRTTDVAMEMIADGLVDREHYYGTINCDGVNAKGEICGVTTTSGLAWKIPGRAGDSPILGAGLYVDGDVGAAGSTGRGEANLYNLSSFRSSTRCAAARSRRTRCMTALKRDREEHDREAPAERRTASRTSG